MDQDVLIKYLIWIVIFGILLGAVYTLVKRLGIL